MDDLEDAYRALLKLRSEEDPRDSTSDEAEVDKGETCEAAVEVSSESPTCEAQRWPTSPSPSPPPSHPPKMEGFPPTTPSQQTSNREYEQENRALASPPQLIKMENSLSSPHESSAQESSAQGSNTLAEPFNPIPAYDQNPLPYPVADPFLVQNDFAIGVGRQLAPFNPPWECIFATGNPPRFCGMKFFAQHDLLRHFCVEHHPMRHETLMGFYICRMCQMWNDEYEYCLQCGWVDPSDMELWLCGYPQEMVLQGVENMDSGSFLPTSGSSGSMTEGRSTMEDEDANFEGDNEMIVAEAISIAHQRQQLATGNLFSRPEVPRSEHRQRPPQTPPDNTELSVDISQFFETPEHLRGQTMAWNEGTTPWQPQQDDPFC